MRKQQLAFVLSVTAQCGSEGERCSANPPEERNKALAPRVGVERLHFDGHRPAHALSLAAPGARPCACHLAPTLGV